VVNGYAAVQVWGQAAEATGSFALDGVAQALRSNRFDTPLGSIGFDPKGDVTGSESFAWHVWKDGKFTPLDQVEPTN
jgi:branched-chain amino acid transport system substrate-binding protein